MTAKSPTPAEARQLTRSCPYCYARAGEWCTRPNGRGDPEKIEPANQLHGQRAAA